MFDINKRVTDEQGDWDEGLVHEYIEGMMEEFAASPEAKPLIDAGAGVEWAGMMMQFAMQYIGSELPKLTVRDFDEILYHLFPKKVSTQPESAPAIIGEIKAFFRFVERQYGHAGSRGILKVLESDGGRLHRELSNPDNFGMGKSFFMAGTKAGFDMTTEEGTAAFGLVYNAGLLAGRGAVPAKVDETEEPDAGHAPAPLPAPLNAREREVKRQKRKAERKAKKKNRR